MNIIKTKIDGVLIIEPQVFADARGYFFESYQQKKYQEQGIDTVFVQDNASKSDRGVVRGLHMQLAPMAQGKLVWVPAGKVMDAAVDCRVDSVTFGQYISVEISEENKRQLWIPRGLAHGFQSLEDNTIFCYKCDNYYSKEHELSIVYNDSGLNIQWPISEAIVSEKDLQGIMFKDLKKYLK